MSKEHIDEAERIVNEDRPRAVIGRDSLLLMLWITLLVGMICITAVLIFG